MGEKFIAKINYRSFPIKTQTSLIIKQIKNFLDNSDNYYDSNLDVRDIGSVVNLIGIILVVILFLGMGFIAILDPRWFQSETWIFRAMVYYFGISAAIWILFPVIALPFRWKNKTNSLLFVIGSAIFQVTYELLSLAALPVTFLIALIVAYVARVSLFLLSMSFKRAIVLVTFPLVFFGNLLQFVSTFLVE